MLEPTGTFGGGRDWVGLVPVAVRSTRVGGRVGGREGGRDEGREGGREGGEIFYTL